MTLSITVPTIANDVIWFASKAAWEAYWAQAFVTVDATLFDAATEISLGTVYKSATVSYGDLAIVPTYNTFQDLAGSTVTCVDQTTFEATLAKVDALGVALDSLLTNLKAAGIVA